MKHQTITTASKKKDGRSSIKDTLAAARKALAARHTASPVPAYNGRTARIDAAAKRARRAENAPPPEQMKRVPFIETDINEHSLGHDDEGNPFVTKVRIGRAYLRQARFETIDGLSAAQLSALRRYRRAFDASEVSPVKSALDIGPGGGTGGAEAIIARLESLAFADEALRRIERLVSPDLLGILRGVALDDLDFKALALAKFDSTSGNRRALVKEHFMTAVDQLTVGLARPHNPVRTIDSAAAFVEVSTPEVDPAFLDDDGRMRPYAEIADIIRDRVPPETNADMGAAEA